MARHGKRLLLTLSLILAAVTGYSQAVTFSSTGELRAYGPPTARDGYKAAVSVIKNNRQIIYFWNDTCKSPNDTTLHIRPVGMARGCWEQVTGPTAIATDGIKRNVDTFSVDSTVVRTAEFNSFRNGIMSWTQTVQTSSQAQSSNANLQFQIDNKANRSELGRLADTGMLKSAMDFIETQVDTKADYAYVNELAQTGRTQDSTEIAAVKAKTDSVLVYIGGFPATLETLVKMSRYDADRATTQDVINMLTSQMSGKLNIVDTTGKWQPRGNYQVAGNYALNSALITKVNYLDTALMLQPYARTSALAAYQPIGSYATVAGLATKLNVTDTAGKWLPVGTFIPSITGLLKASDTTGKWLPANTVIPSVTGLLSKSDADGYYKPLGYVPTWAEITAKPSFATVATSGAYSDLTGRPTLATVATSGNYNDLTNKPTIPVTSVNTQTGAVVLTTTNIAEGTSQYFTNARAIAAPLTGLATGTNTAITASNTVLTGLQNLQAQITAINSNMVVNAATVGLSKATLNSTYPTSGVGFMVFCPNILLGGAIYIRVTTGTSGTWQTISAPPTL